MFGLSRVKDRFSATIKTVELITASGLVAAALCLIAIHHSRSNVLSLGQAAPVSIRSIQSSTQLDPREADQLFATGKEKSKRSHDSKLITWIKLDSSKCNELQDCSIELRGLRSSENTFWLAQKIAGQNVYERIPSSQIREANVGLIVKTQNLEKTSYVIGQINPKTSRPLAAYAWKENALSLEQDLFERTGGILFGSLCALALFSAMIALLHRDLPFLLLAGWLIATLRLASLNGGWDLYWYGIDFTKEQNLLVARFTLGCFGLLSAGIFAALFSAQLHKYQRYALRTLTVLFTVTMIASFGIDHGKFMPTFWSIATLGLLVAFFIAAKIAYSTRSSIAALFLLSWAVISAGAIGDMLFSMGYLSTRATLFNLHSAAIAAGFIKAIALANRMQLERKSRLAAERSAVLALTRYRENYEKVPVGLFSISTDFKLISWNPKFEQLFENQARLGISLVEIFPDLHINTLNDNTSEPFEIAIRAKGATRWFELQLLNDNKQIEGTISEITVRKLSEERLEFVAHFDQLTGIYNRNYILQILEGTLRGDVKTPGCLTLIDIDRFHQIVTYFGHAAGDEVLRSVRARVQTKLDSRSIFGRLSADTFILLSPSMSLQDTATQAKEILEAISEERFTTSDKSFLVRARAAVVPLAGKIDSKEALGACDAALAEAKRRGDGIPVVYFEEDQAWRDFKAESAWMAQFRLSIPFESMEVVFQPIVGLSKPSASLNYEALLRMQDGNGKAVSPGLFIPALEKTGLMSQLDRWVVRQVFTFLRDNPLHFSHLTYASVNLSGASLNDSRFLDEMLNLAEEFPNIIHKVCFEITESVALSDIAATKHFISSIKNLGGRIALDDFGAGYSSFGYLSQLRVDFLKIDGNLVKGVTEGSTNYFVLKAIANLGQDLNIGVVAEWVEDGPTLKALIKLGVNSGQGWALSKPLSAKQMATHQSGDQFVSSLEIRELLDLKTPIAASALA